ncbi:extensin-like [Benincasa hispida]|uniref:extensin-like n=1 Tax=Benincasa hispida TaxID=102211 RepID=UPI00190143E9|nr:extensin-like [Benincasa hispida]
MSFASDNQNQTMSFENNSPVSSYSFSSVSTSPPPSPRKTSKSSIQIKLMHGGATSTSQQPSQLKPTTTPTKLPSKTTKAIATLPTKTPQPKPKTTPKPKPKTPLKLRKHLSSTAANKLYTKPTPPPFIPNITSVGATYDPIPAYLHNAPSPTMRPPPPPSIQPLATIYLVESGRVKPTARSTHRHILLWSPHTPSGTPPIYFTLELDSPMSRA